MRHVEATTEQRGAHVRHLVPSLDKSELDVRTLWRVDAHVILQPAQLSEQWSTGFEPARCVRRR